MVPLLVALYVSQGLPSGFLAHALPALLREQGVSLTVISWVKLLALPWFFKCTWAHWIDRYGSARLGHYRGWILLLQSACVLPLLVLATVSPVTVLGQYILLFAVIALLVNTCMATQDVAADALVVRLLPVRWRGVGNSVQVVGYKLGMLAGGSGLLWLIGRAGWQAGFTTLAVALLLLLLPVLWLREPTAAAPTNGVSASDDSAPVWQQWSMLFHQPRWRLWWPVLLTYKLADAVGSTLIKPLLIDAGYALEQVGHMGFVASLAGMVAAVVGGVAYRWWGVWRCLFYGGLMQAVGLALYAWVALGECSEQQVYLISVFEQMADAFSTVSLFAAMMGYCRPRHEGGDYTLQMSLFMVLSGTVALGGGAMASAVGLPVFFVATAVVGVVCLGFVVRAAVNQSGQTESM